MKLFKIVVAALTVSLTAVGVVSHLAGYKPTFIFYENEDRKTMKKLAKVESGDPSRSKPDAVVNKQ